MLTDDVIDEDIEALLYAQIHYGQPDPSDLCTESTTQSDLNPPFIKPVGNSTPDCSTNFSESFADTILNQPFEALTDQNEAPIEPQYDGHTQLDSNTVEQQSRTPPNSSSLEESASLANISPTNSLQDPTEPTVTTSSTTQPSLSNITINQYIYPDNKFWSCLSKYRDIWSRRCAKDLRRVQKGKLDEKKFFNNLKRRQRLLKKKFQKQEEIRKVVFGRRNSAAKEVIILSDSDSSDVEFVGFEPAETPQKKTDVKMAKTLSKQSQIYSDSDSDEIIYIEPPPVPVVTVDDESDEEEEVDSSSSEEEPAGHEEASNDFLLPAATSETFNFSLHGAEFQETQFARPDKPTDTYENESSTTSTSELNKDGSREFNNSVKTIVFNEVDFPREDIFEGSNLDKFGDLIAPSRTDVHQPDIDVTENVDQATGGRNKTPLSASNDSSDSESSSESGYEVPMTKTTEKTLPDLCPIELASKKKDTKKTKPSLRSEEEEVGAESSATPERRRESHEEECPVEDTPKKKGLNKRKAASKSDSEEEGVGGSERGKGPNVDSDTSLTKQRARRKKKSGSKEVLQEVSKTPDVSSVNEPLTESTKEPTESAKKRNKKNNKSVVAQNEKRTKKRCQSVDNKDVTAESGKKKKKRKQKLAEEVPVQDTASEEMPEPFAATENVVSEQASSQRPNKRKKRNPQKAETTSHVAENKDKPDEEITTTNETVVDDDVVLIEQVIPTHTVESSDSEDDDIVALDKVDNDSFLEDISRDEEPQLGNVSNIVEEEDFDVKNIQNKMSDDPEKWKISDLDRYDFGPVKKGPRCNRCRHFGHIAIACPNKPSIPSCSLCGYEGHMEPRCPNRVCFTCAKPGNYSTISCRRCVDQTQFGTCYICKLPGHVGTSCPDLWRRYYLTTKVGPITNTRKKKRNLIPRDKWWCSGCAERGHLEHQCNSFKWIREYPTTSPQVFSYANVYEKSIDSTDLREHITEKRKARELEAPAETREEIQTQGEAEEEVPLQNAVDNVEEPSRSVILEETREKNPEEIGGEEGASLLEQNSSLEIPLPPTPPPPTIPSLLEINVDPPATPSEPTKGKNIPVLASGSSRPQQSPQNKHRRSPRKPKINPCSVVNPQGKYAPYQRMLNPCSMLGPHDGAQSDMSFNIDNVRTAALNSLQSGGLFNSNPGEVLAHQILTLTNAMASAYQPANQNCFNMQGSSMAPTISFLPDQPSPNNFVDEEVPLLGDRYHNYMAYRNNYHPNYIDRPYSMTSLNQQYNDYDNQQPIQGQNFVDHRDTFKSLRINNVEDVTAKKFTRGPVKDLLEFIKSELEKLDKVKNSDAKQYKRKMNSIDQLKKIEVKTNAVKKQIYFNYKHINMYLFGIRRLAEGKHKLDFLRNFVLHPGNGPLRDNKRKALLEAYGYIFGGEHPNFNYRKFLNHLSLGHGSQGR